jgi:glycosidase
VLRAETIFQVFEEAGYETALIDGKGGRIAGLEAGVTHVKIDVDYRWRPGETEWVAGSEDVKGDLRVMENLIEIFLENQPKLTFALLPMVDTAGHLYGHESVEYLQAIEYADQAIGMLVENLRAYGVYENTYLIITSDHGMTGDDHGSLELGDMAIPLIVSRPDIEPVELCDADIVDVAQTICDFFGLRAPENSEGTNLFTKKADNVFSEGDVIYQVMVDRFYDGDPTNNDQGFGEYDPTNMYFYHGGDWQGIIDKLPYIDRLGVTAIWISSVHHNQWLSVPGTSAGYHGYWVHDYYSPEPHFGTLEKLQELVRKASARGIAVITEALPNHVGDYKRDDPAEPKEYRTSAETESPTTQPAAPFNNLDWYHHNGHIVNWDDPYERVYFDLRGRDDPYNVYGGLDDLAQEDPDVKNAIFDVYTYWRETVGFAAYRFDASKHVPDDFRPEFQENVVIPCFGESWIGDPVALADHWRAGMLWGFHDFPLMHAARDVFAGGQGFSRLSGVLAQDWNYPNSNRLITFVESHDVERFLNVAPDGRKLRLALTFILTARGVPTVYYGSEQGLSGGADPYNREDMPAWEETETYIHIRRLSHIRRNHEALQRGSQLEIYNDEVVYAYRRVHGGKELVVVLNNTANTLTRTITIPDTSVLVPGTVLTNLLDTDDEVTVGADWTIQVSLEPFEGKVYATSVS